jgi:hypothetical protein
MPVLALKKEKYFVGKVWGHEYKTPSHFIDQLFRKLNRGFSPIIGICGEQQNGKSFIGVYVTWLIHRIGPEASEDFDPTKNTFYDPETAIMSLIGKRRSVTLIDEAGAILDYREWWDKAHQSIRHIVNTQAKNNNCYIFISPFISEIDKSARKHFSFKIIVTKRGVFKTFKYIKRYDAEDASKSMYALFLDDLSINLKDMPKEIWKKYLDFSSEQKERMLLENTNQPDKPEWANKPEWVQLYEMTHGGIKNG